MKRLKRMIRPSLALAMILVGAPVFAESSGACADWENDYPAGQESAICWEGILESECETEQFFPDKTCDQAISELPVALLSWDGACESSYFDASEPHASFGTAIENEDCFLVAIEDGPWGPDDFCGQLYYGEYLGDGSTCSQSVPTLPDTAVGILLLVLFVIAWAQLRRKTAAPPRLT